MPNVTAYIRKEYIKKNGKCAVNSLISIDSEKIRLPIGVDVDPREWDEEKGIMKGKSKQANDTNLIIRKELSKINNIFVRFRLNERPLTKRLFMVEYKNEIVYVDFWHFMETELKNRMGTIAENTYRAQYSTLLKFKNVLPGLQFQDLNEDTIRELKKVLAKKYGNSLNTITKNMITLKTYVSIAVRKKFLESNPFELEKIKRYKANPVWLTENELAKLITIYKKEQLPKNLNHVLQYFLFSCFTGMRLSDVKNFDMEQVKGEFIIINPIKTKRTSNDIVSIPITKPIKQILKDAAKLRLKGRVFDCYADAATNRVLKKIAESAGINKEISFHSARHTFASIFLEKTDDLATLQKLLGHSDIKQTMVYVHMSERKKVEQMSKCWNAMGF